MRLETSPQMKSNPRAIRSSSSPHICRLFRTRVLVSAKFKMCERDGEAVSSPPFQLKRGNWFVYSSAYTCVPRALAVETPNTHLFHRDDLFVLSRKTGNVWSQEGWCAVMSPHMETQRRPVLLFTNSNPRDAGPISHAYDQRDKLIDFPRWLLGQHFPDLYCWSNNALEKWNI